MSRGMLPQQQEWAETLPQPLVKGGLDMVAISAIFAQLRMSVSSWLPHQQVDVDDLC